MSGTHVDNVDGQLGARPRGPGGLTLLLNRGSEVFRVDDDGRAARASAAPRLRRGRRPRPRPPSSTVERLAARGLQAEIVSQRLNRRKIDLIPEPGVGRSTEGAHRRAARPPSRHRLRGAPGSRDCAKPWRSRDAAAAEAGLADARVTSDAKHVEIGLTDKADSARWIMQRPVAARHRARAGADRRRRARAARRSARAATPTCSPAKHAGATVVSVGVEPGGLPDGVIALGGGRRALRRRCSRTRSTAAVAASRRIVGHRSRVDADGRRRRPARWSACTSRC